MLLLQVGSNCNVCVADLDLLCVERKRNANTCEQWYCRTSAQTSCLKLNTINKQAVQSRTKSITNVIASSLVPTAVCALLT